MKRPFSTFAAAAFIAASAFGPAFHLRAEETPSVIPAAEAPSAGAVPLIPAEEPATAAAPRSLAAPDSLRPGDPVAFVVWGAAAEAAVKASLVGNGDTVYARASFFSFGEDETGAPIRTALLAVPTTAKSGPASLRAYGADGTVVAETAVLILKRDFTWESIPLDPKNSLLRTAVDPKKTAEAEELWKILLGFDPDARWATEPFIIPTPLVRRTAGFGDRRRYKYSTGAEETGIHAGIDFGVPVGTPVTASARGKVVFARERIVTGNTVIIEHLPGVFSQYYHLSRIDTSPGSIVEAGAPIGLSGSTGISTGPHLHWEVRVGGEAADPDALAARRLIDKDTVLSKIKGSSVQE